MSFLTPDHLVRELYLKAGDRVADIGAGAGAYTIALAREVGDIGQVYAVDVHRDALHTLAYTLERQSLMNVDIIWADVEQEVPIEKYSLDAVVMSNVLFQLDNLASALTNVATLLKPEGQLLVVEWSGSHHGIGPHKNHVITEFHAEELVTKYGFRIIKRLPAGDFHYAFIALSV
jgi:ubiquinone/menaquinone biosynthesis C-methylase UbiE